VRRFPSAAATGEYGDREEKSSKLHREGRYNAKRCWRSNGPVLGNVTRATHPAQQAGCPQSGG
jgi:hypothetical protein